jgi:fibronectin-binding autotransporter adhesin
MHMPLPIIPIPGKINRVLTAGVLLWTAIWSLEATTFSQTRASSPRSRSAAQGQGPRKSQPVVPAKALTTRRRPLGPASTDNWTCANGIIDQNWNDPMNWDNGIPNAGSDVIVPNATSTCAVNVNGSGGNVSTLQIMAGGEVIVIDGSSLTINGTSITNDGQLFLNATSNRTKLLIVGNVTLSGSGRLVMSNDIFNSIDGGGSLFNHSTIEGSGDIGFLSGLRLNNFGIINSNNAANTLYVGSIVATNTGTLESTSNSELFIYASILNAGGTIGGDNVTMASVTILGGTLSAGTITGTGDQVTLNGVTLSPGCQYIIPSTKVTILQGTITNSGQIKLSETTPGSGAKVTINGTVTLTGSGAVTSNGPDNKIDGSGEIINQQTIQGLGTISVATLTNQGTISALPANTPFTLQIGSGTNTGLIQATSGSKIDLFGGTMTNAGGNILADSGLITMDGQTTTVGGTVSTNGSGVVELKSATLNGSASPVRIAGFAEVLKGDIGTLEGLIEIDNKLAVDGGTVGINGNVTLNPSGHFDPAITGTVTMSGSPNTVIQGVSGMEVLTNNITIQGAGNIGNGLLSLVNGSTGQIIASSSSIPLVIAMGPKNAFTTRGLLSVAANPGSAASVLTVKGPFKNFNRSTGTLSGGSYNISGTLQFDNANILKNAAKLTLAGPIVDQNNVNALLNFANNTATGSLTILPQTFGTNFTTAGPFSNAGKVMITPGVALVVGASGTNYNQTGGTTTVDGRLAVTAGGLVNITGGTLQGGGALPAGATISGSVSVGNASSPAGTFIIGDSNKKSGLIAISNNYIQLATGVLDVQIGGTTPGTQYSQLNITGTAALTGTLNIAVIKPFKPTVGQTFTILNASTGITGTFSVVNGTVIDPTKHFTVSYNPTTVVLTVVSGPAPRDQSLAIR